jgi:PAS domain S-box-containing protein
MLTLQIGGREVTADRLAPETEPLATSDTFGGGPTAEETLRATFDLAAVGIVHVALDGRALRVNQKLCDIFGLTRDQLLQYRFQELTHPDDLAADLSLFRRLLAGEIPAYNMEKRYIRSDGKLIWADLSVSLARDNAGRPSYCISVVVDITERKLAQEELRESAARARLADKRLAEAIATIGDALALWDSHARLVMCNDQMLQLWGDRKDLLVPGAQMEGLLRAGYTGFGIDLGGRDIEEAIRHRMAMVGNLPEDFNVMLADGRCFMVRERRLDDGGFVTLYTNVTEMKRKEEELLEAEAELQGKVADLRDAQRRLETMTKDLVAARDAAEAANRAKSAFLAAMSHEIRTPMSGMIGFADLLLETPLNQQQHRFTKALSESASALLTIIDDILDFSKLEARRVTLKRVAFDPQELIDSTVSLLAPTAQSKGLNIETTPDRKLPRVLLGDPGRLRQVLLNLIGNALKFTERGYVRVTASHRRLGGDRVELRIEIADSGIGIPADARAWLFTRFSQADSTTPRAYGGTGLGLAISKELCELMGGTVGYESEEGKGSRFWLVVVCNAPPAKTPTPEHGTEATKEKAARRLDILVVEDHKLVRTMIADMLAELGHNADLACDGQEAVAAVQARRYDLVLMDAQMPKMDGAAATKAIRALDPPANAVPIVALTAHAIEGYRDACVAAGMNDYLSKPVKLRALSTLLARWSARAPSAAQP